MGLRKKLKVLHFMGGEHLPDRAGLYLVIDGQYLYRTCTAEHREDGSFDLFRCTASGAEIPGTQVLTYAALDLAAHLVEEVYSPTAQRESVDRMIARGFMSIGQIESEVYDPKRVIDELKGTYSPRKELPGRVLSLVPKLTPAGEPNVS